MRGHQANVPYGKFTWMKLVIWPQFPAATSCPVPKYMFCELTRAKKWSPQVIRQEAITKKGAMHAWDKYQPGDFVFMNQFVVSTQGCQLEGYG